MALWEAVGESVDRWEPVGPGPVPESGESWTDTFSDVLSLPRKFLTPSEATLPERMLGLGTGTALAGPLGGLTAALHPRETGRAARTVARYGAPISGGLAGAAAGAAVGQPIAGEMIGAAGGELLGQVIGGEDINLKQAAVAGALPGVAKGITAGVSKVAGPVGRAIAKAIPGTAAWLHEMAHQTLWGTVKEMKGIMGGLDEAWDTARRLGKGVRVPTAPLRNAIESLKQSEKVLEKYGAGEHTVASLLDDMTKGFMEKLQVPTPYVTSTGQPITQTVTKSIDDIPFNDYDLIRKRLGEYVRKYEVAGGPQQGIAKKLYGAAMDGLDDAFDTAGKGATPAIEALRNARTITKQTLAFEELRKTILKPSITAYTNDGEPYIRFKGLMSELHRNEDLRAIGGPNMNRLRAFVQETMRTIPRTPEASVAGPGALMVSGISAGLGATVGGPPGAMVGAVGGPRLLAGAADRISRMMLSETGRNFLNKLFKQSRGTMNHQFLTALFQVPNVALGQAMAEPSPIPAGLKTPADRPQSVTDWERVGFDFKKGNR